LEKVIALSVPGNNAERNPISLEDRDDDALMLMARAGGHLRDELQRVFLRAWCIALH
jgi:hypothetical protein